MRQRPTVVLIAGLGGLFTVVNPTCAQPWAATTAPAGYWKALAPSADGTTLVAAGLAAGYCIPCYAPIYVSADAGSTWALTTAPSNNWVSVSSSADGTKLVALVDNSSFGFNHSCIYSSSDSGATWVRADSPAVFAWSAVASSADGCRAVAVGRDGIYILQSPTPAARLPSSPRLNVDRWGANFTLSWLVPSTRFFLQQSPDLGPANWVDVPDAPALDCADLHYRVTLTPSHGRAYYRLKHQ